MTVRLPGAMTWSNPYAQPEKVLRTLRETFSPELQCVVYGLVLVHRLFITCPYRMNTEIGSQDLEILQFDIVPRSTHMTDKQVWWKRIWTSLVIVTRSWKSPWGQATEQDHDT